MVAVARLLGFGGDRLAEALGEAESAGLVVLTEGAVEFRHPLVLSAVYAAADPSARRQVHRAVADLPEISPDQRAWHLAEAAVLPDEPVAAGLVAVADRATARSAHAVAAAALERAAALSPAAPVAQQRLLRAATSAWLAGRADRAGTLLDRVEAIGPPPPAARTAPTATPRSASPTGCASCSATPRTW